jgi:putative transposase
LNTFPLLVFGRRQLEQILRGYLTHYNTERPHRALELAPPAGTPAAEIRRRDVLGRPIHEYHDHRPLWASS